jgi:hypothetical protein
MELKVGFLKQEIIDLLNLKIQPGEIRLLSGGTKHIKKKHVNCFNNYFLEIPEIIKNPDYVGTNPKYLGSIEYIKKLKDIVLIAVRLNRSKNLIIFTMYEITDSKIINMINSGRIKCLKT